MEIYVTSKNSGPSWSHECHYVIYIGPSMDDAVAAVGDFARYEKELEYLDRCQYPEIYTAIPKTDNAEYVAFYGADGWWASVVKLTFED